MRRKDREVTRHGALMEMVARFKVCRLGLWDGREVYVCLLYTSVFRRKLHPVYQQVIGSSGDADAVLVIGGLSLFVKRHDHALSLIHISATRMKMSV